MKDEPEYVPVGNVERIHTVRNATVVLDGNNKPLKYRRCPIEDVLPEARILQGTQTYKLMSRPP
jgi:hypothetical protein